MTTGMEIEFKYRANDINLADFMAACVTREPTQILTTSGWDHFYDGKNLEGFARHRVSPDLNQLTYKRKTTGKNNYVREEDNLDLSPSVTTSQIASFLSKFEFKHNKTIFKNCFIYKYARHTVVYYIIYSQELEETGRFVEIEMAEDHPWASEEQAYEALVDLERQFKTLGITPQSRMKKSLYELVCG